MKNFHLADYSLRAIIGLAENEGWTLPLKQVGSIKVFRDEAVFFRQKKHSQMLQAFGLEFEELNRDEAFELEPCLANDECDYFRAIRYPQDVVGDARQFSQLLVDKALENGGELRENTQVRRLSIQSDRVNGVIVDGKVVHAKSVVICAGTHSPELANEAGVRVPIQPVKGYSFNINSTGLNLVPKSAIVDDETHIAVSPLQDRLRVVGMADFVGFDDAVEAKRLELLKERFRRVLPSLSVDADVSVIDPWVGFRPMSASGRPIIGRSRIQNLWLNTGHGHLGWTMALGSALLMRDLILGQKPDIDPTPFACSGV